MKDNLKIPHIGEAHVILELAKRGVYADKQSKIFGYNIITENYVRIKVFTSSLREEKPKEPKEDSKSRFYWSFTPEGEKKDFDFYVFVGLDESNSIEKSFVVPINVIKNKQIVSIPRIFKISVDESLKDYEDKWGSIIKFQKRK